MESITPGSTWQTRSLESLEHDAVTAWCDRPRMAGAVRRRIADFHDGRSQRLWGRSEAGYRKLLFILTGAAGEPRLFR